MKYRLRYVHAKEPRYLGPCRTVVVIDKAMVFDSVRNAEEQAECVVRGLPPFLEDKSVLKEQWQEILEIEPIAESVPHLSVEIEDGKYTIVQEANGELHALRNGKRWRDCVGDKLILCLAQYVENLRLLAEEAVIAEESQYVDWALLNSNSPDYDPAYKIEYPESVKKLRARLEELKK